MSFRRNLMKICAVGTIVAAMTLTLTVPVGAEDLNDIGGGTSYTQEANGNAGGNSGGDDYVSADDFKEIYNSATPSQEEMQAAAEISKPVVKVIRTVMSFLLAVLPALMLLNCIVDILCLTVSPLRKAMLAVHGGGGASAGGMGMGMGMGGMGMGAPAGGGGGQPVGIMQWIGQWASKEAVDVAQENGGAAAGGGMGMGMGMGGMGMGMGAPAGPAPKAKVLLVEYFKKKTVFLVAFGVCIIVFSCTAFTDLGLEIGEWIITKIGGISL